MTRNQQRATRALVCVVAKVGDPIRADYKALVNKLPALIQQSGLAQALVFVQSRKVVGPALLDDLARTYDDRRAGGKALRDDAQRAELPQYLALTRDLVDCAVWLRRFTQIELGA